MEQNVIKALREVGRLGVVTEQNLRQHLNLQPDVCNRIYSTLIDAGLIRRATINEFFFMITVDGMNWLKTFNSR